MTCKTYICPKSIRQILSPYADNYQASHHGNSTTLNNHRVTHQGLLNMNERGKEEHKLPILSSLAMAKH